MCLECVIQDGVKFEVHTVSKEKSEENETDSDISSTDIFEEMDIKSENDDDASPTKKNLEMLEFDESENDIFSSEIDSVRSLARISGKGVSDKKKKNRWSARRSIYAFQKR